MKIAVILPCYRVKSQILGILKSIGPEVASMYVVDDACPDQTGAYVQDHCKDPRLKVVFLGRNHGVGGAVIAGYRAAMEEGADVLVKMDGDGQMDPAFIRQLVGPIQNGFADYAKGNRFYSPERLESMPWVRLMGNSVLSLLSKVMSGYYTLMDPTNGYTAVHSSILRLLPLEKIDARYFFESDMLFRLGALRAMVIDVPMTACYGKEQSHLKIQKAIVEFMFKYAHRSMKRILYNYFIRDFNVGTIQLILGLAFVSFGSTFGVLHWTSSYRRGAVTPAGTVMLAAIPVILGFQMLLAWVQFDIANAPRSAIHPLLQDLDRNR